MATVTITLSDTDDGKYRASVEFDPPRDGSGSETPAQRIALAMMHAGMMAAAAARQEREQ